MTSGLNIIIETPLGGHYKRENGLKNRGRGIWERDMRDQRGREGFSSILLGPSRETHK